MCDSLVATAPHARAGTTLFAKNSDRKLGECQPLRQFPAAVHPRGAQVRCTHVVIPQVAETYRLLADYQQAVGELEALVGREVQP